MGDLEDNFPHLKAARDLSAQLVNKLVEAFRIAQDERAARLTSQKLIAGIRDNLAYAGERMTNTDMATTAKRAMMADLHAAEAKLRVLDHLSARSSPTICMPLGEQSTGEADKAKPDLNGDIIDENALTQAHREYLWANERAQGGQARTDRDLVVGDHRAQSRQPTLRERYQKGDPMVRYLGAAYILDDDGGKEMRREPAVTVEQPGCELGLNAKGLCPVHMRSCLPYRPARPLVRTHACHGCSLGQICFQNLAEYCRKATQLPVKTSKPASLVDSICKLDTDKDGNCPIHPTGCMEARPGINKSATAPGMTHQQKYNQLRAVCLELVHPRKRMTVEEVQAELCSTLDHLLAAPTDITAQVNQRVFELEEAVRNERLRLGAYSVGHEVVVDKDGVQKAVGPQSAQFVQYPPLRGKVRTGPYTGASFYRPAEGKQRRAFPVEAIAGQEGVLIIDDPNAIPSAPVDERAAAAMHAYETAMDARSRGVKTVTINWVVGGHPMTSGKIACDTFLRTARDMILANIGVLSVERCDEYEVRDGNGELMDLDATLLTHLRQISSSTLTASKKAGHGG